MDTVRVSYQNIDEPQQESRPERPREAVYITGYEYSQVKGALDVIIRYQPASED